MKQKQEIVGFLKTLIDRLTDYDIEEITDSTTFDELDLVSLDFVTIKVEAKNELGIDINLNALAEADINTFGKFVDYIEDHQLEGV